jgi:hypothetical protein
MSSAPTKNTFFRRILYAAPLVVLLLMWPATPAWANIFDAFTACFNTVTSMGGSTSNISGTLNQHSQFMQSTVYPQNLVNQAWSSISSTTSTYRPWMNQVMGLPTNSATMPISSQLEAATRGGISVAPSQMQTSYQTTYGAPLTAKSGTQFTQTVTDMSDAQALDVFSLTSATDSTANDLVSQAHSIEDSAGSSAPGNADHLSLQGKALELQSIAMRHKLLAANLRLEAVKLANENGKIKQEMVNPIGTDMYTGWGTGINGAANKSTTHQPAQ